jgi:3-oxoacyl-(acyl-carrier-protein) synthase
LPAAEHDNLKDQNKNKILDYIGIRYAKKIDRSVQLFLYSTENLLAEINLSEDQKEKTGIFLGNNYASWLYVEDQMYGLYRGERNAINPYVATAWFPAAAQGELSIRNNIFGISKTFSLDLLSSAIALDFAIDMLHSEKISYAIVGGYESLISPIITSSLTEMKLISHTFAASEAASAIILTKELSHKNKPMAVIYSITNGESLQNVLADTQEKITGKKIDYCILPTLTMDNLDNQELLRKDITTLYSELYPNIPVGMPSYFMGEICGANFAVQIAIALWVLENQHLPASYINQNEKYSTAINFSELSKANISTIMIIGRDYYASRYFALVIGKYNAAGI